MGDKKPVLSHILSLWNATGISKNSKAWKNSLHVEDWNFVTRHYRMPEQRSAYCGVQMEEGQVFGRI